jgi:hypothetical protein
MDWGVSFRDDTIILKVVRTTFQGMEAVGEVLLSTAGNGKRS